MASVGDKQEAPPKECNVLGGSGWFHRFTPFHLCLLRPVSRMKGAVEETRQFADLHPASVQHSVTTFRCAVGTDTY